MQAMDAKSQSTVNESVQKGGFVTRDQLMRYVRICTCLLPLLGLPLPGNSYGPGKPVSAPPPAATPVYFGLLA